MRQREGERRPDGEPRDRLKRGETRRSPALQQQIARSEPAGLVPAIDFEPGGGVRGPATAVIEGDAIIEEERGTVIANPRRVQAVQVRRERRVHLNDGVESRVPSGQTQNAV